MAFIKKGQQEDLFIKNKDTDIDTANVAVANITTLFAETSEISDLEVTGSLQVTGTPFTVDWTDVTAEQKTITLNDVPAPANPTDTNADQGGIILKGSTDKTILYDQITDSWTFTPEITTASLSDVDLTTNAPQPDEALIWDQTLNTGAGGWKPGNVDPTSIDFSIIQNLPTDLTGYGITASIDDLSDVDTSTVAPTADQILIWNAQANSGTGGWEPADNVPGSIDWSTITNTPTDLAGYGITDALTTSSTLDDLVGVDITTTPPTADQILKFDATLGANGEWVPADNVPPSVDWSTITNKPALSDLVGYNIVLTTGSTLSQLADISNATPTADQILKYSPGSGWLIVDNVPGSIDWSTVTNTPTDLAGYGITDALSTSTVLSDLVGVSTTAPSQDQILKFDASNGWEPVDNVPPSVDWSTITSTPTTLVGYGITNALDDTTTLSDLVGVSTTAPTQDQILVFDSTNGWQPQDNVPGSINWSTITSTPTTLTGYGITDALNTSTVLSDLVGVSTTAPSQDQILVFDVSNGWEPKDNVADGVDWANITGTPTTLSGYNISDALNTATAVINDLNDVDTTGLQADQVLKWDGSSNWIPTSATLTETVTSLTYNSSSHELTYTDESGTSTVVVDLSVYIDSIATITSGSFNSTTGIVTYTRTDNTTFTIDFSALLPGITYLSTLSDTNLTGANAPSDKEVLVWNQPSGSSGEWIAGKVDWSMVDNTPTNFTGYGIIANLDDLANVDTTGATLNKILIYNGTSWEVGDNVPGSVDWSTITNTPTDLAGYGITDALTTSTTLTDLVGVSTTAPSQDQILVFDASNGWQPQDNVADAVDWSSITNKPTTVATSGLTDALDDTTTLSDLVGVSSTTPTNGQILIFDSTNGWEPGNVPIQTTVDWSTITNTPTDLAGYGITDALSTSTVLSDLVGVSSTAPSQDQILIFDSTNGWEPQDNIAGAVDWTSITNKPTTVATSGLTDALSTTSQLSDLANVHSTAPTQDQILVFDSTNGWQPQDNIAGAVDWTSITNKPTTVATSGLTDALDDTTRVQDLANVSSTTPTAGQILIYHAVNGWEPSNVPAPTAVAWTSITGKPTDVATSGLTDALSTSSTLNDLSGVNVQGATQGQVLQFDSTNGWEPATPATFSETVTALSYDNVNNILSYTDESNVTNTINLSYLIDQNLPFISSGSFDPATKLFTLTRDDGSSFTVNLAGLASIVSLSGLTDTDIGGTPTDQYVLTWDSSLGTSGKWTAAAIPTPSSLQYINDISNVDAPTALLDQALLFNPSSGNWEASDIIWSKIKQTPTTVSASGLTDALSTSSTLGDLSGVDLTTIVPTVGKALVYNGTNWVADILTVSNITMDIGDLQDVNTSNPIQAAVQGSALVWTWNGSNFEWQPGTLQAYIGELFDVDTTTAPQTNELLVWDSGSSKWKPGKVDWTMVDNTPTDLAGYGITDLVMISGVNVINDLADINSTAPSDGEVLTWDATASEWKPEVIASPTSVAWSAITGTPTDFSGYGIVASIDDLSDVDTSTNTPTNNQVLTWDSSLNSGSGGWKPADVPPATETLTTLVYDTLNNNLIYTDENSQVTTISLAQFVDTNLSRITSGTYNSSTNKIRFDRSADNTFVEVDLSALVSGAGASVLTDLTDVQIVNANLTGDELLSYDNSTSLWKAVAKSSVIPTSIGSFSDVDLTGITSGQVLKWVNNKFEAADDVGGSSYADSDVDTHLNVSGATTGQILSWNGTDYAWVADQTGSGGSSTLAGLTDTNTTNHPPVATDVLTWTANNTWEPQEIPAGFDGDYNSLTNKPTLYADSDVDTHLNQSSATTGQILSWNGTDYAWVADQTGSTIVPNSAIAETGVEVEIIVKVSSKTANHRYNGQGSGSGYIFTIDGVDYESPFLDLVPGKTYKFNQGDSSNSSHGIRFYEDAAKTTLYSTGVTTSGNAGTSGAYTSIAVTTSTLSILHYQCVNHGYMGNQVQVKGVSGSSGSSVSAIDDLSDVDTSTNAPNTGSNLFPDNKDILVWNGSNWIPQREGSGVRLEGLSNVNNFPYIATGNTYRTAMSGIGQQWNAGEYSLGVSASNAYNQSGFEDLNTNAVAGTVFAVMVASGNSTSLDYYGVFEYISTHPNNSYGCLGKFISGTVPSGTGINVVVGQMPQNGAPLRYFATSAGGEYFYPEQMNIGDLSNVDITTITPSATDVLTWTANNTWEPQEAPSGGGGGGSTTLSGLTDTDTTTHPPVATNVLTWTANNTWEPQEAPSGGGSSVADITDLSDVDTTTNTPSQGTVLLYTANNLWEPATSRSFGTSHYRYDTPWAYAGYDFSLSWNDQSSITTGSTYDTWSTRTSAAQPHLESMAIGSYFLLTNHTGFNANTPSSYVPQGVGLYRKYADHTVSNPANNTRDYYFTFIGGSFHPTSLSNATTIMSIHVLDSNIVSSESNNNFKFEIYDNRTGTPSYQTTIDVPEIPISLDDLMDVQLNWSGTSLTTTGPVANNVLQYSANGYWQAIEPVIDNLADVDTVSIAPSDGDVLTWDGTINQWKPLASQLGSVASITELGDVDTTTITPSINDVLVWTANNTFETQNAGTFWKYNVPWASGGYDFSLSANDQSTISTGSTYDTWSTRTSAAHPHLESMAIGSYFLLTQHSGYPSYSPGGVGLYRKYADHTVSNNANNTRDYYFTFISGSFRPTVLNNSTIIMSIHVLDSNIVTTESDNNFKFEIWDNKSGTPSYQGTIESPIIPASLGNLADVQLNWSGTSLTTTGPVANNVLQYSANGYWQAIEQVIDNLADVDTVSIAPSDGDVLTWDATTSQWKPLASALGSVASIDELGDVDTTTIVPSINDVLVWTANNTFETQDPGAFFRYDAPWPSTYNMGISANDQSTISTGSTYDTWTTRTSSVQNTLGSIKVGEYFLMTNHSGHPSYSPGGVSLFRCYQEYNVTNPANNTRAYYITHIDGDCRPTATNNGTQLFSVHKISNSRLYGNNNFKLEVFNNKSGTPSYQRTINVPKLPVSLDDLMDVQIDFTGSSSSVTGPTTGDVLTWSANGFWQAMESAGGGSGSYADSDVDTHLNVSAATSGQILSWNGSDYAWVADQTGSGGGGGSVTKTIDLTGDVSSTIATAGQILMWDGGTGKYVPTDGHLRSFSDVASTQPGDKEVLRWNVTNSEYESQLFPDFYTTIGNNQTPAVNSLLGWTANNAWEPVEPSAGINGDLDALTDVTYNNRSNQSPSLDDVIQWTANNAWEPMTPPQGFDGDYNSLTNQPTIDDLYPTTRADYFGSINHDMIPSSNEVYDLGSSTKKWKDLFLSGTTINLGTINLKSTASGGFQIQKAAAVGGGNPGDPAPLDTDVDWSNITNVPTTILGYGITDSADISTVDNVGDVDTTTISATEGTVLTWTANNAWEPQLTQTASSNSRLKVIVCDGQSNTYQVDHKAGNVDIILNGIFMIPQITDWSDTTGTNNLSSGDYDYQSGTWDASTTTFTASSGAQADATHFKFSFIPDLNDKLMIRSY